MLHVDLYFQVGTEMAASSTLWLDDTWKRLAWWLPATMLPLWHGLFLSQKGWKQGYPLARSCCSASRPHCNREQLFGCKHGHTYTCPRLKTRCKRHFCHPPWPEQTPCLTHVPLARITVWSSYARWFAWMHSELWQRCNTLVPSLEISSTLQFLAKTRGEDCSTLVPHIT